MFPFVNDFERPRPKYNGQADAAANFIYCLFMTSSIDELSALFNSDGDLHSQILFRGLTKPARVELLTKPAPVKLLSRRFSPLRALAELGQPADWAQPSDLPSGRELRFWYPARATQSRAVPKKILDP